MVSVSSSIILWMRASILGPSLSAFKDWKEVLFCPNTMIIHPRKVFDSTSPNQNMGMFLKGMKDSRNIGKDGSSCTEFDLRNLSLGGIGFFGLDHIDPEADPFSKGRSLKGWNLGFFVGSKARGCSKKLTKGGHKKKEKGERLVYLTYPLSFF